LKNTIRSYKIPKYILASKQVRFFNFILDLFFIYLFSLIVHNLAGFIEFQGKFKYYSDWIDSFDASQRFIFRMILWFFYYGFTELFLNRSLAKFFTKTIVVLEDGSKPRFSDILARTITRLFPLEPLTFLKGRELGLHDENSKTFVVRKAKLEKSKKEFFEVQYFEN
jgi:uncharacterized RDD family membrane protein YckC